MWARFRARTVPRPVSGQLCETTSGGLIDLISVSCRLSAAGIRFLGILSRQWNWSIVTSGLPPRFTAWRTLTGFPCSARMRYDWDWAPLYPGNGGVHTAAHNPWPPPAVLQRPVPVTLVLQTVPGCAVNEASARVHWYSPRAQSSPRLWPPDGAGALGLSRELRTRPPLAAAVTHVTVGTGLGH